MENALFAPVKIFGRRSALATENDQDPVESQEPVHIDFQAGVIENDDSFGMRLRLEWRDHEATYAIEVGQQVADVQTSKLSLDLKVDLIASYLYPHLLGYATSWMSEEARVLGVQPPALEVESYRALRDGFLPHVREALKD